MNVGLITKQIPFFKNHFLFICFCLMFIVLYMCPTTSPGLVPKVGQVLTTYSVPLLGQVVDPISSSFIGLVYRTIHYITIEI